MFEILKGSSTQLPFGIEPALATYRYEVFCKALKWDLPAEGGLERDQFDRADTMYVVATDTDGSICGCARLLPTTKPYLLNEVFPELMNGSTAPSTPHVWELSRFSTMVVGTSRALSREEARRRFCNLFASVVDVAARRGATRLITFTALGVERILRSIGMHAHRVGPPKTIGGELVIPLWIELDDQTRTSLGMSVEHRKNTIN
jgi:acyl homoserine lactone synthase